MLLVSFAAYLVTLAPEVTFWDSGELAWGAVTLGIPHPPGYPVFCHAGKIFSWIPFGNAAYRLNLMSAAFCSLTAYLVYRLVLEMGGDRRSVPLAVAASLSFAFAAPFWGIAVIAEVYALNTLLLAAVAYLLFRYDRQRAPAYLHASAFIVGLAAATHQSVVFLVPAYAAFYFLATRKEMRASLVAVSLFFVLFGYSVILYLPVRAAATPPINVGDPSILYGFKWALKLSENMGVVKRLPTLVDSLIREAGIAALLLGSVAACASAWALRKRPYILFLVFFGGAYFAGIRLLTAGYGDINKWGLGDKFYIPTALAAALIVPAVYYFASGGKPGSAGGTGRTGRTGGATWAYRSAAWLLLAVPLYLAVTGFGKVDHSKDFYAFDFGTNTLKSAKQGGAIIAWGDNGVFPVWYLQGVERYRDDVFFLHTELLSHYWYTAQVARELLSRYGIVYEFPKDLLAVKDNMPALTLKLELRTPTYLDYSAARQLDVAFERLRSQGLIHMVKAGRPDNIGEVWGRYVLRGAYDGTTNKQFAAEGILGIYAFEAAVWAQQAYNEGRPRETVKAYDLARKLGLRNEFLDKWVNGVRTSLAEGKK